MVEWLWFAIGRSIKQVVNVVSCCLLQLCVAEMRPVDSLKPGPFLTRLPSANSFLLRSTIDSLKHNRDRDRLQSFKTPIRLNKMKTKVLTLN